MVYGLYIYKSCANPCLSNENGNIPYAYVHILNLDHSMLIQWYFNFSYEDMRGGRVHL
jgi:hypothetical protein